MSGILAPILALSRLATRIGNALWWLSPTLARVTVGWLFLKSGWGKLHDLQKVTNFFIELGLPAPAFQAHLVATTEFVCGALLLIGLFTRLAAVPLVISMIVAIRTALWPQIDHTLVSLFGQSEFLYIVLLTWLGTAGPGPLSLDWLIERSSRHRSSRRGLGTPPLGP